MKAIIASCCGAAFASASACAQFTVLDDFNDGDYAGWTLVDPTGGAGTADASTGELHFQSLVPLPPGAGFGLIYDASTVDPTFSNGVFRAKVRMDNALNTIGIAARLDGSLNFYYAFLTTYEGGASLFLNNVIGGVGFYVADVVLPELAVGEDWNLEFGLNGDRLSLSAWQVGDAYPGALIDLTDASYAFGACGMVAACNDGSPIDQFVNSTFDDFQYAIPAPAGAFALAAGVAGLRRRR